MMYTGSKQARGSVNRPIPSPPRNQFNMIVGDGNVWITDESELRNGKITKLDDFIKNYGAQVTILEWSRADPKRVIRWALGFEEVPGFIGEVQVVFDDLSIYTRNGQLIPSYSGCTADLRRGFVLSYPERHLTIDLSDYLNPGDITIRAVHEKRPDTGEDIPGTGVLQVVAKFHPTHIEQL